MNILLQTLVNSLPPRKRGRPVNGASGGKGKPEKVNLVVAGVTPCRSDCEDCQGRQPNAYIHTQPLAWLENVTAPPLTEHPVSDTVSDADQPRVACEVCAAS